MKITITLDDSEVKILSKRAKKNLLTVREQVEDIIRRSCVSGKQNPLSSSKSDDSLVDIFSRAKRRKKSKKKRC